MWQADEAKRARIQQLVEGFVEEIPEYWEIPIGEIGVLSWNDVAGDFVEDIQAAREENEKRLAQAENELSAFLWETKPDDPSVHTSSYTGILRDSPILSDEAHQSLVERLKARFGIEFLDQVMPEFLMYPDEHDLPKYWLDGSLGLRTIARYAREIANDWVVERGDNQAAKLIAERLKYLLSHPAEDPDFAQTDVKHVRGTWDTSFYYHHVIDCIQLLVQLYHQSEALIAIKQLVTGAWNFPLVASETSEHPPGHLANKNCAYAVYNSLVCDPFYKSEIINPILESLCATSQLDYQDFVLINRNRHYFILSQIPRLRPSAVATLSPAWQTLYGYSQQLLWEMAERLPIFEMDEPIRLNHFHAHYYGSRWLLLACTHVEKLQLSKLVKVGYKYENDAIYPIAKLAGIHGLVDGEDPEQVVSALRKFSKQTLLVVAAHAGFGRQFILQALGWDDLLPLLDWANNIQNEFLDWFNSAQDQFASKDAHIDIIDRQALLSLLANLSVDRISAFIEANIGGNSASYILETVTGRNSVQLKKSLKKESQLAIKAYGLLPLEADEQALDRYLQFKKIAKDSSKYGAERQTNTRAAVQIGLANFAQTAGYPDLARMEWDMEAKVVNDGVPLNQRVTIGDWEVELQLDGLTPEIICYKQGKPLKSIPAGIKKREQFLAFKETQARIKDQVPRFRMALETMMVENEAITMNDLQNLSQLPIMSRLLQALILRTKAGEYGFFDPEGFHLAGLKGVNTKLSEDVQIAHPYHFFQDGVLPDWQREVVRQHIVQPFKQVYRELYVLTPAEEQTGVYSNRFAGHLLQPMTANGLIRKRGWKSEGRGPVVYKKCFRKQGLTAEFAFPDADEDFPRSDSVTSDQIRCLRQNQPVPLIEIPPLVFSEVMRDADLVVSVAQIHDEDSHWSTESYQRRVELVTALCDDLGLADVRCEGHFGYIKGKLASYRVHLGSAAIHIEPGNYLCIVPARSEGAQAKIFLPFADTDSKTSEVISKILMLANDGKIKDPSILQQIEAARKS